MSERLKELTSFLQQQGFVWGPSPEIYGGVAGFYTYGPTGTLLKRRVEEHIRKTFAKQQIMEVETPIILPKEVWEASGHLAGFTDPLINDKEGGTWRADKLIEDFYKENEIEETVPVTEHEILEAIKKHKITAPGGKELVLAIKQHNLMMQTTLGLEQEAYNRPETATATYLPFMRYVDYFRQKLPFGVFQIGKAYRNEISPRKLLLRLREFTQAEAQIFIEPEKKDDYKPYQEIKKEKLNVYSWEAQQQGKVEKITVEKLRKEHVSSNAYAYTAYLAYHLFAELGIPDERLRLRQHGDDEKAFYAADAWDVEVDLPTFGWTECCGVHDRTDYDLKQHAKASKQALDFYSEDKKERIVPHVLEIAFGVDRPVLALLDIFYDEKEEKDGKTTLKLPHHLAPFRAAVLPLVKKLSPKAKEVFNMLNDKGMIISYDESGSIGKRYLRESLVGTPVCITIDFDTLEDDTVTIRDRDTEEQQRVKISDLVKHLK